MKKGMEQILLDHDRTRGIVLGGDGEWSCDVEWLLEEAAHTAARRDWRRMGVVSESVAYGFLVASYSYFRALRNRRIKKPLKL